MRTLKNISRLLILSYLLNVSPAAADASGEEQDRSQLALLDSKVNQGDDQALLDVAKLGQSVAIPYLSRFVTDYHTDPARSDLARDVLAKMPGHGEYLRRSVAKNLNDKGHKVNVYRVLTRLRTKEAVKALAYFLINDDSPGVNEEDVSIESGKMMAAMALGEMNLSNAPTDVHPHTYRNVEIAKWQQWWIQHQTEYQ